MNCGIRECKETRPETLQILLTMRSDVIHAVMATWATKDLPARLDVVETAKLLGFAEHDIQILMASGKLNPLGDPAPNAPKWFAAMEVIRLAADNAWLHKATKEVSKYWRQRRERQQNPRPGRRAGGDGEPMTGSERVSPNSSPKPSPNERWRGNEGAMASDERAVAKST
jgi:hypothetical protein